MNKNVQVMLSAYNGEKYIVKQIESILNQNDVNIHILIRDDGSTDNTVNVVNEVIKKYPSKIDLIKGKNLGYKKSFLELCHNTPTNYDYYAFSDQDDFWLPNKIEKAINYLSLNNNKIKLYASTVNITDEHLKFLYKKNISNFVNTLGSSLTRIRLAGCTYVFNVGALNLIKDFKYSNVPNNLMPSHDGLLMILCQALNGYIYIDKNSYILHRRRSGSVTSGGNGLIKRIKIERNMMFDHKNDKLYLASYLKQNYSNEISKNTMKLINLIVDYPLSLKKRFLLLLSNELNCGIKSANLETKIRIIMGIY